MMEGTGFGETILRKLLDGVQNGEISIDEAVGRLKFSHYEDMGFAKVDHHRHLRQGFPEVVYCQGKSTEQIVAIMKNLASTGSGNILATRALPEVYDAVHKELPEADYHAVARVISVKNGPQTARGNVLVVTAGTADIPVAEEAAITCEMMGNKVERLFDVGVAGLHRFLNNCHMLYQANVIVVVAGMEGALASVVGGMVDKPVIAVPTSVGYGASLNGIAALLSMLNSCSSNVSVVNIDNGFGGGYIAGLINKIAVGE
jgi:NCAIR mutase (PurE)-related protein